MCVFNQIIYVVRSMFRFIEVQNKKKMREEEEKKEKRKGERIK